MDDQHNYVMTQLLDSETKFNYLNHYHQNMIIETDDEIYALKLDTLYEWWWQI